MKICLTRVSDMTPTQITVGLQEVQYKKEKIKRMSAENLKKYLKDNPIPAVIGSDGKMYLTDKHHMGRALTELGIEKCYFRVQHDLSDIPMDKFFPVMEVLELVHPYNEFGKRVDYHEIPQSLKELKDDPYRSLASVVKRMGGFIKINKAYIEFEWAEFLRNYISPEEIYKNIDKAATKAFSLCVSEQAHHMLGYIHNKNNNKLKKKFKA